MKIRKNPEKIPENKIISGNFEEIDRFFQKKHFGFILANSTVNPNSNISL